MKIVLCTPLSSHSAIARASKILAAELERREQFVSLISIELEIPKTGGATSSSLWWKDPKAEAALGSADAIVVQIGDNYTYHAGAIEILSRFRCIGIFHDANIYNLFRMWAFDEGSSVEGQARHDRQLAAIYGDELKTCENPDLLRWLASQCAAALVHSDFYLSAIRDYCPGPVAKSRLAYDARPVANSEKQSDRFTVLTLGHINANKCCSEVIEGIAALEIKPSIEYRLAGPIAEAEQEKLAAAASAQGVRLTVLGRVSDEEMAQELGRADVVCCLRRPVLEGASASAIEAMLSSRPIIVADSGFYAEIDEAAAIKLPANFGVPDITQALNRLISDDTLRESLGRWARVWASEECSLSHYTDVLEALISSAVAATPYLELARAYADQLSELGFNEQDAVSTEIADRLQELCSDEQS